MGPIYWEANPNPKWQLRDQTGRGARAARLCGRARDTVGGAARERKKRSEIGVKGADNRGGKLNIYRGVAG